MENIISKMYQNFSHYYPDDEFLKESQKRSKLFTSPCKISSFQPTVILPDISLNNISYNSSTNQLIDLLKELGFLAIVHRIPGTAEYRQIVAKIVAKVVLKLRIGSSISKFRTTVFLYLAINLSILKPTPSR